jgi:hypothetical protein
VSSVHGHNFRIAPSPSRFDSEPLTAFDPAEALLAPLFALCNFRAAASHLISANRANQIMAATKRRLTIDPDACLLELHNLLPEALAASRKSQVKIITYE